MVARLENDVAKPINPFGHLVCVVSKKICMTSLKVQFIFGYQAGTKSIVYANTALIQLQSYLLVITHSFNTASWLSLDDN